MLNRIKKHENLEMSQMTNKKTLKFRKEEQANKTKLSTFWYLSWLN